MKFQGTLTWMSPVAEGVSKAGNAWRKVEIVITEDVERYPNEILVSAFNARVDTLANLQIGQRVEVDYDARVRIWKNAAGEDRRSLELNLYTIAPLNAVQTVAQPVMQPAQPIQAQPAQAAPKINFDPFNEPPF